MFYNKQKNKDKDIPCQGTSAHFSPHQVQVHSTMDWTCYVYYTLHGLNNYAPPSALENSHPPTCCHKGCTIKTQNQTVRWEFWSCRLVVFRLRDFFYNQKQRLNHKTSESWFWLSNQFNLRFLKMWLRAG